MDRQARISEFLSTMEEGSYDRACYETVFDVLIALDTPLEETYGFACMNLLEGYCIWLKDGRDINGPHQKWYATFGEIAETVAVIFASMQKTSIWWKVGYTKMKNTPEVLKVTEELLSKLKHLPNVERVGDFSDWPDLGEP
jgi:hypothetical protein